MDKLFFKRKEARRKARRSAENECVPLRFKPLYTPMLHEGNLTVDLRPENALLRDAFYQVMRK